MDVASDRDKSSYLVSGARKSTSKIKLKQAMKLSLPLRAFIHNNVNWIKESEFVGFLPDTKESPYFKLNCQRSCVEDLTKLKLFESKYVYSDANSAALFVGDPVWTVAWCPIPDDAELTEQYVAISTNKAQTHAHNIYKCETTRGIIQLWNCGKLQKRQDKIVPYLALGITYDYGPIWDMKWCPSGCWQQQTYEKSDLSSRLGLLAMACGDGKVRVLRRVLYINYDDNNINLTVPQPASLRQQQKTKEVIFNIIPHAILIPKYDDITNSGQAICLAWMSSNQHRFLAAGFADGTIAIWDLMTESRLLLCNHFNESQMTRYYFPFRIIAGHDSVIRSIAWCPSNGDYFATGWFTSIVWPRHRRFLFLTEEDSTSGYFHIFVLRNISSRNDAQIVNLIKHSGASLAQSFSEWSTNIVSGSECGELYGFNTAQVLTSGTISTKFNQRSKYFWDKTSWSKSDYSIAKPSKYNPVAASSQKPLHEAIQAVSWNPNRDCHTWLLSGSKSGMLYYKYHTT
ncbi:uncharacterized protein TRIADDRAFT_58397 [Trichoplax adhaerens]|uniref:Uncharacterized protein n=1 Tax=Trichoplax adhaerens TaxID=10228 RepID=B3S1Z9_TRIAD|nr:hypothetical protein TRIADDRAFT_58397 [Trichoplax adhaerens]EDV23595.1 hypothetical protein TRIADDRAFT_58397 [Trichoplax adhaerens]|eukprot:XP_002114505.1 hypothetical protein TRIADDRAFT_58397 [Trichoplax adhaerens]